MMKRTEGGPFCVKLVISRLIAVLLLVIPGVAAAYGFLLMKDAVFDYFAQLGNVELTNPHFAWLRFAIGFVVFLCGVAFIGGWIFFRDRKHNYLSSRFRPKRPRPPKANGGSQS